MHYKGTAKTAPEIGRELGVDTLVEGTVQHAGNRVRIRIQVIDSASDRHLWARSYDHELKDVLLLQSSAARDIAEEVQGKVAPPQADFRPTNANPVNPVAYEAYLKGRYFWNKRTEDGLKKSIDYFQQAISQDPKFAAAYAGMADTYSILGSDVLPARLASSKAHVAASKALELDPTIAEGHAELALVEFYYDWDWPRSEQEFRRAIELNPNYATAHQWYSYYLTAMTRFPEAVEEARRRNKSIRFRWQSMRRWLDASATLVNMTRRLTSVSELWKWTQILCARTVFWEPPTKLRETGRRPSSSTKRRLSFRRTIPPHWRPWAAHTATRATERCTQCF